MARYLTISADYLSSGIKDDFNGELQCEDLPISLELWELLTNWVKSYSTIIQEDVIARREKLGKIKQLDDEGILILKKISQELGSGYKIRYYSEGLLKYLFADL
jgi:hypothetical protein